MAKFNFEINVLQSRGDFTVLWLGFIGDLDLFYGELVISRAILTELGCHNSKANLALHQIGACNFNKNVLSVETDLSSL